MADWFSVNTALNTGSMILSSSPAAYFVFYSSWAIGITRVAVLWCKNTKNSCLLTLPSAGNNKKKMVSFACVSLGGMFVGFYLFIYSFMYCFTKAFLVTSQQERLKDIMGYNLWLALTLAVLLGWPRTSKALVKVPVNLLDEFKFHMSLKWMLP